MSHIIKNSEDMHNLQKIFTDIADKKVNNDNLKPILETLMPKSQDNKLLTTYYINKYDEKGRFLPTNNTVYLSPSYINRWVEQNKECIETDFNIKTANNVENYLKLYIIMHEIEHAYQYLIANGKTDSPNNQVKEGYNLIFSILNPSPYPKDNEVSKAKAYDAFCVYRMNPNNYILERNANYETSTILTELALNNQDRIPYYVFRSYAYSLAKSGYREDQLGCFYHTFKNLGIIEYYTAIKADKELDFREKIRYGLEISPNEREELLKM